MKWLVRKKKELGTAHYLRVGDTAAHLGRNTRESRQVRSRQGSAWERSRVFQCSSQCRAWWDMGAWAWAPWLTPFLARRTASTRQGVQEQTRVQHLEIVVQTPLPEQRNRGPHTNPLAGETLAAPSRIPSACEPPSNIMTSDTLGPTNANNCLISNKWTETPNQRKGPSKKVSPQCSPHCGAHCRGHPAAQGAFTVSDCNGEKNISVWPLTITYLALTSSHSVSLPHSLQQQSAGSDTGLAVTRALVKLCHVFWFLSINGK